MIAENTSIRHYDCDRFNQATSPWLTSSDFIRSVAEKIKEWSKTVDLDSFAGYSSQTMAYFLKASTLAHDIGHLTTNSDWVSELKPELEKLQVVFEPNGKLMFSSIGRINNIENENIFFTFYDNWNCDNPQNIILNRTDLKTEDQEIGNWFKYEHYKQESKGSVVLKTIISPIDGPVELTEDQILAKYDSLIKQLPDEF